MRALPLPDGLSVRAQAIWRQETALRTRSAGRVALLEQGLRALDRAEALRAQLTTEGLTVTTKTTGAVHLNPLVRVEAGDRALFVKIAKVLNLDWRMGTDGGD